MNALTSTPKEDGFRMPGEYEPHKGTIMIWPVRPGSWPGDALGAKKVFSRLAVEIAKGEQLYMLADREHVKEAGRFLREILTESKDTITEKSGEIITEKSDEIFLETILDHIHVVEIESDDAWARDVGPTYVVNDLTGEVRGINWKFNAWGGTFDGLYMNWDKDDQVAVSFMEYEERQEYYDAAPFVLEGGSIHSDGEGTILVTESCLLSGGRNPEMSKEEIEEYLKMYLGGEKVIWLPRGIYQDETNEHVDNVCAFVRPASVVLAWTDDESDPQYPLSKECLDLLEQETDAKGRRFQITKLPIPKEPVCITQEELDGYVFEEGEDAREAGERLAASYVNFYIANESVLVPQFMDENDERAVAILKELFPERRIVPIFARDIIVGGGNIHCITQQIPAGGQLDSTN